MNYAKLNFMKSGLSSRIEATIYRNVRKITYSDGKVTFQYRMQNPYINGCCHDIRLAALAIDKHLIRHGKEPINILKRKPQ